MGMTKLSKLRNTLEIKENDFNVGTSHFHPAFMQRNGK